MNEYSNKNFSDFDFKLAKLEWLLVQVHLYRQLELDLELAAEGEQWNNAYWKLMDQLLLLESELSKWSCD